MFNSFVSSIKSGNVWAVIGALLFVVFVIAVFVFVPFLWTVALNFILEAGGYAQIPYTLGSWFGGFLLSVLIRGKTE